MRPLEGLWPASLDVCSKARCSLPHPEWCRAPNPAQDSGYRGLVALGIGAVGGTAVAAFTTADRSRLASQPGDEAAAKVRPSSCLSHKAGAVGHAFHFLC